MRVLWMLGICAALAGCNVDGDLREFCETTGRCVCDEQDGECCVPPTLACEPGVPCCDGHVCAFDSDAQANVCRPRTQ